MSGIPIPQRNALSRQIVDDLIGQTEGPMKFPDSQAGASIQRRIIGYLTKAELGYADRVARHLGSKK